MKNETCGWAESAVTKESWDWVVQYTSGVGKGAWRPGRTRGVGEGVRRVTNSSRPWLHVCGGFIEVSNGIRIAGLGS